ncbi:MAG: periplasmic heavy metal sensor [Planctomycetes bacterium]|nr:periplasmic heavy metal sensor [Planctomycetota bacterium]
MKVNFRQFIYALGIVGVILLSSNVYSQTTGDFPSGREAKCEKMRARMLEVFKQLDLSPEQEKQLNAHRKMHREQGSEIRTGMRAKREAMKKKLQKQDLDMKEINFIHSELKRMHSTKADHRLEGILGIRKILTTEQFVKFMDSRKELHTLKKKERGGDKYF